MNSITYSEQAAVAAADLKLQTQVISKVFTLNNGRLVNNYPDNFRIIGDIENYKGTVGDNQYYMQFVNYDDSKSNVACSIKDISNEQYTFECVPLQTINGTLYIEEIFDPYTNYSISLNMSGEDNSIYFQVGGTTSTSSTNPVTNRVGYRKTSSGLSGGAIAGIVIACAVVLIIGSVVAMMLRKPKAPLDNSTSVVGLRTVDNYSQ